LHAQRMLRIGDDFLQQANDPLDKAIDDVPV
jgi:hypothetical protein